MLGCSSLCPHPIASTRRSQIQIFFDHSHQFGLDSNTQAQSITTRPLPYILSQKDRLHSESLRAKQTYVDLADGGELPPPPPSRVESAALVEKARNKERKKLDSELSRKRTQWPNRRSSFPPLLLLMPLNPEIPLYRAYRPIPIRLRCALYFLTFSATLRI